MHKARKEAAKAGQGFICLKNILLRGGLGDGLQNECRKSIWACLKEIRQDIQEPSENAWAGIQDFLLWCLNERLPYLTPEEMIFYRKTGIFKELTAMYEDMRTRSRDTLWRSLSLERLLDAERKAGSEPVLGIAVQLSPICYCADGRLSFLVYSRKRQLSSETLYYAIINGLVEADRRVLDRLKEMCLKVEGKDADRLSLDNPVYVLTQLHEFGLVSDISGYFPENQEPGLIRLVSHPESFSYSEFQGEWWEYLRIQKIRRCIAYSFHKVKTVLKRLKSYQLTCPNSESMGLSYVIGLLERESRPIRLMS